MSLSRNKSITLLELLISLVILGLMVLGFSNLDTFTRYHVLVSDRQAKLQNDASYILEHMAKEISKAIGSVQDSPAPLTITDTISGDPAIKVWVDSNGIKGQRDASDKQIAYRYRQTGTPDEMYQVWYCPNCSNEPCADCTPQWGTDYNVLSGKISSFNPTYDPDDGYIDIQVTARWYPNRDSDLDNPQVTLRNRINLPSVSSH